MLRILALRPPSMPLYLCQFIWYVRYVQQCVILWAEHSFVYILRGATFEWHITDRNCSEKQSTIL